MLLCRVICKEQVIRLLIDNISIYYAIKATELALGGYQL